MALTPRRDTFDPGNQLNPMWPPPAPGHSRPRPRRRSSQQPDPGYDDDYDPQFIPPYVPPGPGQQSPFQPIPPGQIIPPVGDYVAQMPRPNMSMKHVRPQRHYFGRGYNPNMPVGPRNMSPGAPGVNQPSGVPSTGTPDPSHRGSGHVPTIPPRNPTFEDTPWYPPFIPFNRRPMPNSTPLLPASISPVGGMYPSMSDIGNMMMPGVR